MFRLTKFLFILIFLSTFYAPAFAQDEEMVITGITRTAAIGSVEDDSEDEKGSTVRGRVLYQGTGKPVRHGLIGFYKIKELVEPPGISIKEKPVVTISRDLGADKYALTDSNGEFEIKNIKAGIYQAIVKVPGVLNPSYSDKNNPEFQQFAIDGVSEAQVEVGVRRGASISGRVLYPDGEPIIGAKVQAAKKGEEIFSSNFYDKDITVESTDDRGFYRFAGLPAGEYVVRVTEKTNHTGGSSGISEYIADRFQSDSELKTFYPNVSEMEKASGVQAFLGQEQTGIDIVVPNRRLFKVSGSVVGKNTKQPLRGIEVSFTKIEEKRTNYNYSQGNRAKADEQGNWSFKELPKGKYILRFSQDNPYSYRENKSKTEDQPKYAAVSREIEIDSENVSDINIELPIEATVSGIITVENNKPFPSFISFSAKDNQRKIFASSYLSNYERGDKDKPQNASTKRFTIDGLYEGSFQIDARTQNYYVKSIRLGNRDLLASPLDVKDGDKIEGVQIILGTDVGTLKGIVSNIPPGKRVFVVMVPVNMTGTEALRNSRSGKVSGNGSFEIKNSPGEYRVFAVNQENYPQQDKLEEWISNLLQNAQTVSLEPNKTKTINLGLPN